MTFPPESQTKALTRANPHGCLLAVENLEVVYDDVFLVLRGLSLSVTEGEVVALLGANGAGKSTVLKAITGLLPTEHGAITDGTVSFGAGDVTRLDAAARVRRGISLVMEGRRVFEHLTVHDNLVAGAYSRSGSTAGRAGRVGAADFDRVYAFLPRLAQLRTRTAGYLSGGEQQMLAIGRALMARPRLLLLDEPSLGLAPLLVDEVFAIIRRLNLELGLTALLVEQNARRALGLAHRGYVMEAGRIVLEGTAAELAVNPDVKEFYLGLGEHGHRRSYRDVKHYKRRKRWL
ncbi:ABC transporter ATP-binding protein [Pendulispora albinea]|uniref:ABC transporter ATP-binding protein n=1 Tax=Pendulispora albinea TaxID=2741071 RepID=A0ABZ2LJG8_9BACT